MMVKAIVAGAAGRMGARIIHMILQNPDIELSGAYEISNNPAVGRDAGQVAEVPLQTLFWAHSPVADEQTVPDAWYASVGQVLAVPLQVSATSQPPADARQVVPDAFTASVGQAADEPEHVSAVSHSPEAARQV